MARLGIFLAALLGAVWPLAGHARPLPYAGQVLHVLAFRDPHGQAVAQQVPQFEALTGATVQLDLVPTQALSNKVMIDQAGGGSYDLYAVDEPYVPLFSPLLLPLSAWPEPHVESALAWQRNVYAEATWEASSYQGEAYGLPVSGNVYLYVYRADLFDDAQERARFMQRFHYPLAPPRTLRQMRDIAAFFTRPPALYGFAPFTQVSEGATVEALWILSTFGTRLFDAQMNWVLDDTKAEAAFAYYCDMMQFAPPGAAAWHHGERMGAYRRGQIAQIMTWPIFFADLEKPDKSLVAGRNRYALPPAGPDGQHASMLGTWTLAIPRTADNPRLAAEFASWWTSRRVGKALANGGLNPIREDLLADPALLPSNPWFGVVHASLATATVRPRSLHYRETSDLISMVFSKMVSAQVTPHEAVRLLKDGILHGETPP